MRDFGFFDLDGVQLREDPAREACFRVVHHDRDMHEYEGTGELARREMVHRHMSNELTSLDIAAQCVADFPDAPWELRMELARQCWDEARHVAVLARRLEAMGGHKGEFPVSVWEWNITCALDSLVARLATQNRTLEAGAMDVVGGLIPILRAAGDEGTAEVLEGILTDEIQHVRFANRWIKRLVKEDPRNVLRVASAVRFLAQANAKALASGAEVNAVGTVVPAPDERVPMVNVEDRRAAEFNDAEIEEILHQARFRRLVPEAPKAGG